MHVPARILVATVLTSLVACSGPAPAAQRDSAAIASHAATTAQAPVGRSGWAANGDTVWIISNHVRPERRAQFEEFATKFWEAGTRPGTLDSTAMASFRHTRTLYPIAPDSDGTYNYVFIMDPVISSANYDISALLKRLFPAEEAARLDRMLEESMARPQRSMRVVQRLPR